MKAVICTLFEGNYHYGVAALTNSLYANGFRGTIYAGYRGGLPKWTDEAVTQSVGKWEQARVLQVADGLQLVFVQLTTDYHLTNYKPDFMLELLDGPAHDVDAIYYFDPDICVVEPWGFFEEWVVCGVAVCENDWSPLPKFHPRRVGWRRYFSQYGIKLVYKESRYVNGGLVGILSKNKDFLLQWQHLQELMKSAVGGLDRSMLNGKQLEGVKATVAYCFSATDQDALNAAIEAIDIPTSILGKEAMAFKPGFTITPHALGRPKPWEKPYLKSTIAGVGATMADVAFWNSVESPINLFDAHFLAKKRLAIRISRAMGRFYRRG